MGKVNNKGISLIELIIAVAIMSVLAGVIAPQYLKYVERSKRVRDADTAVKIHDAFDRVLIEADDTTGMFGGSNASYRVDTGNFVEAWSPCPEIDPTGWHKCDPLISLVIDDLGEDPTASTFKNYIWAVELDKELGCVRRIELVNIQSNGSPEIRNGKVMSFEVWPDSSSFRSGAESEVSEMYNNLGY